MLWGLTDSRIGDTIGEAPARVPDHQFAPPTLETVITPLDPGNRARLRVALDQLAEQDPLINVRQDDAVQEISVWLYGEVQKEVIGTTLATDFGIDVSFRETTDDLHRAADRHRFARRASAMGCESVLRHARLAHRARAGRLRRGFPRGRRRPAFIADAHLQDRRQLLRAHAAIHREHARARACSVGG